MKSLAQEVIGSNIRVWNVLENHRELINSIEQTNNSLLSTKQNETMKILTIMAFITFPLSLIASIFGMNTLNIPIIGNVYDFWIVIGVMLGVSLVMFIYFKYKKWI